MMKSEETKMPSLSYISPGRYICDVFGEMRECIKCLNFAPINSLIEEAQILANRMESALGCKKDIDRLHEDLRKLKDARRALEEEVSYLIVMRDGLNE